MTAIDIPDGVTRINEYTFYGAVVLNSITFGANSQLKSIGSYAFMAAYELTAIAIPNTVTTIDYRGFYSANVMTSITIPDSVTIGDQAFYFYNSASSSTTTTVYVLDVSPDVTFEEFQVTFNACTDRPITYVDST